MDGQEGEKETERVGKGRGVEGRGGGWEETKEKEGKEENLRIIIISIIIIIVVVVIIVIIIIISSLLLLLFELSDLTLRRGPNECAAMSSNKTWNFVSCDRTQFFICEWLGKLFAQILSGSYMAA